MDIIIGAHYELPGGRIVRTTGANSVSRTVRYYFDDGKGGRVADESEWGTWKVRRDLRDFPNARDPILPYVFDLLWDLKYQSNLLYVLEHGHDDIDEIKAEMAKQGITHLMPK